MNGMESVTLAGIPVSPGIVIGRVHRVFRGMLDIPEYCLTPGGEEAEQTRFKAGLSVAREQIREIRDRLSADRLNQELLYILDAHLMILDDPMLVEGTLKLIGQGLNAERAFHRQMTEITASFDAIEDPYLREKKQDVEQVGERILSNLMGRDRELFTQFKEPVVLVAEDFAPSDAALMNSDNILGFVTELGGRTSHTGIMAKSLGIPAVVGANGVMSRARSGDQMVLDGLSGLVHIHPAKERLEELQKRRDAFQSFRSALVEEAREEAATRDGRKILVNANIERAGESGRAVRLGADGVGLFRTEFLYMNREKAPEEEEHYQIYAELIQGLEGRPVTIRTADLGGEKQANPHWGGRGGWDAGVRTINPALGLRAVRLSLTQPESFLAQLRAILRAGLLGEVKLLFPMISGEVELQVALGFLERAKAALREEGTPFQEEMPVGVMVEVPSAALCADRLAAHADFLSLGTNDLIQYTLAADRQDQSVAYLYDSLHPAVLKLIAMAVEGGRGAGIPVTLCGEMASDFRLAPLLVGMGVDELSVAVGCLPMIRKMIRNLTREQAENAAREAMARTGPGEAYAYLDGLGREILGAGHFFSLT